MMWCGGSRDVYGEEEEIVKVDDAQHKVSQAPAANVEPSKLAVVGPAKVQSPLQELSLYDIAGCIPCCGNTQGAMDAARDDSTMRDDGSHATRDEEIVFMDTQDGQQSHLLSMQHSLSNETSTSRSEGLLARNGRNKYSSTFQQKKDQDIFAHVNDDQSRKTELGASKMMSLQASVKATHVSPSAKLKKDETASSDDSLSAPVATQAEFDAFFRRQRRVSKLYQYQRLHSKQTLEDYKIQTPVLAADSSKDSSSAQFDFTDDSIDSSMMKYVRRSDAEIMPVLSEGKPTTDGSNTIDDNLNLEDQRQQVKQFLEDAIKSPQASAQEGASEKKEENVHLSTETCSSSGSEHEEAVSFFQSLLGMGNVSSKSKPPSTGSNQKFQAQGFQEEMKNKKGVATVESEKETTTSTGLAGSEDDCDLLSTTEKAFSQSFEACLVLSVSEAPSDEEISAPANASTQVVASIPNEENLRGDDDDIDLRPSVSTGSDTVLEALDISVNGDDELEKFDNDEDFDASTNSHVNQNDNRDAETNALVVTHRSSPAKHHTPHNPVKQGRIPDARTKKPSPKEDCRFSFYEPSTANVAQKISVSNSRRSQKKKTAVRRSSDHLFGTLQQKHAEIKSVRSPTRKPVTANTWSSVHSRSNKSQENPISLDMKCVPLYSRKPAPRESMAPEEASVTSICNCTLKYNPHLHSSRAACERCLYWASEEERAKFNATGHHHRIMSVRGGCDRGCAIFPREVDELPVRLCVKCYYDTHKKEMDYSEWEEGILRFTK